MSEPLPYQTSDTPLAALMLMKGHKFVGIQPDKADRRRLVFIFIKQKDTQELEDMYWNKVCEVDAMTYHAFQKKIFRKLNEYKEKHG